MLIRALNNWLRYLAERLALRWGRQCTVEGVRLVTFTAEPDQAEIVKEKIAAALRLIHTRGPKHYRRMSTFTPTILVYFDDSSRDARYIAELKMCDVSKQYALAEKTCAADLATT